MCTESELQPPDAEAPAPYSGELLRFKRWGNAEAPGQAPRLLRGDRVSSEDLKLLVREECTTQSSDRFILHSLIFEERTGRHDDQH
jgi:hypothetical protein